MSLKQFLCFFLMSGHLVFAQDCNYQTWSWNPELKKSVDHQKLAKSKVTLSAAEKGSVPGCSVCEEDQAELQIAGLPTIKVCRRYLEAFRTALEKAKSQNYQIRSLVGYRVGLSKGALNSQGLRTEFSNHSFGTAIDVNAEANGLYKNCPIWAPSCVLLQGGEYHPGEALSLTRDAILVQAMRAEGFRWGGEMKGQQKDFMHFSLTGQ